MTPAALSTLRSTQSALDTPQSNGFAPSAAAVGLLLNEDAEPEPFTDNPAASLPPRFVLCNSGSAKTHFHASANLPPSSSGSMSFSVSGSMLPSISSFSLVSAVIPTTSPDGSPTISSADSPEKSPDTATPRKSLTSVST